MNNILQNQLNQNVKVAKSKIKNAGNGLFAKKSFEKGEFLCTYGGALIDHADAIYEDPTYIVNFEIGRGFALIGDNKGGDLGHFANAVHPEFTDIVQNAKFHINHEKKYLEGEGGARRGRFNIYALRRIEEEEEIIVNYGDGYWMTLKKFFENPPLKSEKSKERDERAQRRWNQRKIASN